MLSLECSPFSLQTRTEWVETVEAGACSLTALETESVVSSCEQMYGKNLSNDASVYGDGNAAKKIPAILESGEIDLPSDRRTNPVADYFRDFPRANPFAVPPTLQLARIVFVASLGVSIVTPRQDHPFSIT